MSQNSLVLPTTGTVSGLTMTQNINNALDTLNTLASGASAPGTPESGQLWHDTTNNLIKIRDQANANWIALGGIDETNKLWLPPIGGGTASIASAATTDLGSVPQTAITITGTTTITSFGASMLAGQSKIVTFSGALTLTYNATSLILPGAANITTAAGDQAIVFALGSGNFRVFYQPASGKAVVGSTSAVVFSAIAGLLPTSISGTNTTAAVSISAGQAADSTNASMLLLGSAASWAVSNGNAVNGYQGGTTLPNSSTIHFFVINGTSGTGTFASTSLTPTLPAGYTSYYRRIFSLNTNSSGALIAGTPVETEGGSMLFWLATQSLDYNSTIGTTRTAFALTVPTGIKVSPIVRYGSDTNSSGDTFILTSGDETDVAPATVYTSAPLWDFQAVGGPNGTMASSLLTTNTSGQIGARATNNSTDLKLVTRGFKDFRRV